VGQHLRKKNKPEPAVTSYNNSGVETQQVA
jgi:hypothetical protein